MHYRQLGRSGLKVSPICLGTMMFGGAADEATSQRIIAKARDAGVNFIDTADAYSNGGSETVVGRAISNNRPGWVLATKLANQMGDDPNRGGLSRRWVLQAADESLKRLGTDYIDLYQLHRIDPKVPAEKTFEFLQKAQQDGKIRHIGLSEVSVDDIKKAQEFFEVVSVQNMYSVDNRKWEPVLNYCRDHNIAFIPWFPLNAGNIAAQDKLKTIADKHNATVHQVALSWLLYHAENILLIPGTSSVEHLEENMKTTSVELTGADMEVLNSISPA